MIYITEASQHSHLGLGTHLFIKVPQPEDSKGTFVIFKTSCNLLSTIRTTQKGRGNPVSALPKDTTIELASLKILQTVLFFMLNVK